MRSCFRHWLRAFLVFILLIFCPVIMASDLHFKPGSDHSAWFVYGVLSVIAVLLIAVCLFKNRLRVSEGLDELIIVRANKRLNPKLSTTIVTYQQQKWLIVDNGQQIVVDKLSEVSHD